MLTDSDRAFFRPKWRRVAATTFCAAWTILEWVSNEPLWAAVALGITSYCLWYFFYTFDKTPKGDEDSTPD
ncbi:hypothetical protein J9B83_07905 [Marinomonas sp. A79]|uniref:DUF3329 domain-containing protein n=1 Tax=Marinomonas vulgaris TaxID=2823372 RepID=A0ABS5HB40_9GAMM|nr:hypothetical protein [Marinomonas vulgaris]MBR7888868.1 hypothetical protein [Marinomonas vulgaris]